MNEIRDLIIGIDFGKDVTQLCYYDRKADEPRSLSLQAGGSQAEVPTVLGRKADGGDFVVGVEARYFAREKGGELLEDLFGISGSREPVQIGSETETPAGLTAQFLRGVLKYLGVMNVIQNTRCLAVTCESLDAVRVENLKEALRILGLPEDHYLLLDYDESFFYYAMTQQKEPLTRSVAWYAFDGNQVRFRRMTIRGQARPMIVRFEDAQETDLPPEGEGRDETFCIFIQKTLGREMYSSIQITGEGFDQEWAKQSIRILCFQQRKVYYGNNLFARGACAAGRERLETHRLKGYRFLSTSLVTCDVGMDMRVMGSNAFYPLIESGRNWYECSASCELILDDTDSLVFTVSVLGENEIKHVSMTLPGLPARPNKTTRLRVSMHYVSPDDCVVMAEDLGFGDLYPSSKKVWKETVRWQEATKE